MRQQAPVFRQPSMSNSEKIHTFGLKTETSGISKCITKEKKKDNGFTHRDDQYQQSNNWFCCFAKITSVGLERLHTVPIRIAIYL